ncbi:MAG: HAD family hydrolase [Candidatus Zixiibacteriota bacterium]
MTNRLVFWDIDGSLVRGSLERLFVRFLLERKRINRATLASGLVRLALRWPLPKWYQMKLVYLRNQEASVVSDWIEECWESSISENMFDGARDVVKHIRETGARQVLLSGTLRTLAGPLMKRLGITEIVAAEPEIISGRYTGRLTAPHPQGLHKVMNAERWLEEHEIGWSAVTALANHENDRFLLEKAAARIAVHPDRALARIAVDKGWPIVNELSQIMSHFDR